LIDVYQLWYAEDREGKVSAHKKPIVWYRTPSGREIVREVVSELDKADRQIVGSDLKLTQFRFPKGAPILKPLGSGLYEVRSTISGRREFRCVLVYDGSEDTLVIVHAFVKKSQKMPLADMNLAKARATDVLGR
jgi:phage-related protein